MAIKTIECVDCGAAVIYGRLSCSACGTLLASVAGGRRAGIRSLQAEPETAGFVESEPEEAAVVEVAPEPDPAQAVEPEPVADPHVLVQAHVRARPKTLPKRQRITTAVVSRDAPTPTEPAVEPVWKFASLAARESAVEVETEPAVELPVEPEPAAERAFAAYGAPPVDEPVPWAPVEATGPVIVARPYQRHAASEGEDLAQPTPAPGAYRPPTVAIATAAFSAPTGPARPLTGSATAAAGVAAPPTARDVANAFPSTERRIDASTFVDIAGWFVIVGATMSVLGFVLPWSVVVIGSSGVGGYFNRWGLASPTHLVVVIGLLVVLALAVLTTRVPAWLGTGLLGLAFGGLLIGLVWPYLVGPLGADVGVTVTALGGLALVIGGAVASWATRHSESDPRV